MLDRARCESLRRSCSSVAPLRVCEYRKGDRVRTGDNDFGRHSLLADNRLTLAWDYFMVSRQSGAIR
jgi:hypothetical protein